MKESRSNNGYLGQDDAVLHFGPGSHTTVDVVVASVDGSTATQTNVAACQIITITGSDWTQRFHLTINNGSVDGNYISGPFVNISANPPPVSHVFDRWTGDTDKITDVKKAKITVSMSAADVLITVTYKADVSVYQWGVVKLDLEVSNSFEVHYQEDLVWKTFNGPAETLIISGFWNGSNIWKICISPSEISTWNYSTSSSDPGLVINGSFSCVRSITL